MTREEAIKILSIIKLAYPNFYKNITKQEAEDTINLYQEMFQNEETKIVVIAVKCLISTFKFPPTIADIKDQIYKLQYPETDNIMELYNILKKAIGNSIYNAVEEFSKLPPVVQKFVGNPKQLREWAIDESFSDGVLRGQFIKQITVLRGRQKEDRQMLPEAQNMINKIIENSKVKFLNE